MKLERTGFLQHFFLWLLTISCVFLLFSCDKINTSQNTGGLVAKITFNNKNHEFRSQTSKINCEKLDLVTIETMVSGENNHLSTGGPWNCELGRGTIEKVAAGNNQPVVIIEKNSDKKFILRGEETGINVTADSTNETGPIDCYNFVPKLKSPEIGASVQTGTAQLEWDNVPGTTKYPIILWKNSHLKNLHIEAPTTDTNYFCTYEPYIG